MNRRVWLGVCFGALILALGVAPVWACSCVGDRPAVLVEGADVPLTLSVREVAGPVLSEAIAQQAGVAFSFVPFDPARTFSVDFDDVPLEQVARTLAKFGAVSAQSVDGSARAGNRADLRISFQAKDVSLSEIARVLDQFYRGRVTFRPHEPARIVTLDVQEFPLADLQAVLGRMGTVEVH
jgi:hypothetical protein